MLQSLKSKPIATFISVFLLLIFIYLIFSSPAKTWQLPSSSEIIAFSPDGKMLATKSGSLKNHEVTPNFSINEASSTVEIRRVANSKIIQTIDFLSASSLAFSPDNSQIAIGGYGGKVEIHRLSDGKLVRDLKINNLASDRPDSLTNFLVFLDDGQTLLIATTGFPGRITLWNLKNDKQIYTFLYDNNGDAVCLAVSPDKKFLAVQTKWDPLRLYQFNNDTLPRQIGTIDQSCNDAKFSSDGKFLAILDGVYNVGVFSTQSTKNNHLLQLQSIILSFRLFSYTEQPNHIALSPDNRYVAVSFDVNHTDNFFGIGPTHPLAFNGRVRIYDIENGRLIATLRGHRKSTNTIVFSPDGKWLASAGKDNTIRFWRMPPHNYFLWLLVSVGLTALAYWKRDWLKGLCSE